MALTESTLQIYPCARTVQPKSSDKCKTVWRRHPRRREHSICHNFVIHPSDEASLLRFSRDHFQRQLADNQSRYFPLPAVNGNTRNSGVS